MFSTNSVGLDSKGVAKSPSEEQHFNTDKPVVDEHREGDSSCFPGLVVFNV